MELGLYSVYDIKGMVFHTPFIALNDELAIRTIGMLLLEERQPEYNQFPGDFQLKKLGTLNRGTGRITIDEKYPRFIAEIVNIIKAEPYQGPDSSDNH